MSLKFQVGYMKHEEQKTPLGFKAMKALRLADKAINKSIAHYGKTETVNVEDIDWDGEGVVVISGSGGRKLLRFKPVTNNTSTTPNPSCTYIPERG